MTTVVPHSELLRRAVQFLREAHAEKPEKPIAELLDEAAMRFNLSPFDAEALNRLFSSAKSE